MSASRLGGENVTTLGVRIGVVEADISEIKDGLAGLDSKIEKATAALSHEVRAAISALSAQISERARTPWGVIFAAIGVLVSVVALLGSQALAPVQADLKRLDVQIVPRVEHDFRQSAIERRFGIIESSIAQIEKRRYDEQRDLINDLRLRLRGTEK